MGNFCIKNTTGYIHGSEKLVVMSRKIRAYIGIILRRLYDYKGVEIIEANACKYHNIAIIGLKQTTRFTGGPSYILT